MVEIYIDPDPQEVTLTFRAALKVHDRELALKLVLEYEVDINYIDLEGVSLLMAAAYRGYADICAHLLELGADPTYGRQVLYGNCDEFGNSDPEVEWDSVFTRAKASLDIETIELINCAYVETQWRKIKQEAELAPGAGDTLYGDAVWLVDDAAKYGLLDILEDMIAHGVPTDQDDSHGFPPLTTAGSNGQISACLLLVVHGADPLSLIQCQDAISEEWLSALIVISRRLYPGVIGNWTRAAYPDPESDESLFDEGALTIQCKNAAIVISPEHWPSYEQHFADSVKRCVKPMKYERWTALWRTAWEAVSTKCDD